LDAPADLVNMLIYEIVFRSIDTIIMKAGMKNPGDQTHKAGQGFVERIL
jgi:hypothetical protein